MKERKSSFILAILLLNLFITFLGISLVIPVMPTIMNELGINGTTVGYLVAMFALTQFIFSPLLGRAADKFGRKIMITSGMIVFGLSELLFGVGKTTELLFLSRILGGLSAAFIMPAVNAYIADITDIQTRPKAFGYMSAAISTGFIIGPGIGGFLAAFGHRVPFFVAAGFAFFAFVLSVFLLPEPERQVTNEPVSIGKNSLKKIFEPLFFLPFIIIFVSSFGLASFESLFSLFADHKFGFDSKDIAIMITGGAIIGAIFQAVLFDRMTAWWGEISLVRYCLIISIILVFLMTVVNTYFSIMFVTFTVFVGFDLLRPAVTNYLSRIAGNEQGTVSGINSMFTSLGNMFAPIVGGKLFDINLNYPFYFSTAVLLLGFGITLFWREPGKGAHNLEEEVSSPIQ